MLKPFFLPFLSALLFLLFGLLTLGHYGMNWDEPAHYLRGQAVLHYLLTGNKDYYDLPKLRIHYSRSVPDEELPHKMDYPDDSVVRRSLYQYDREGDKFTFRYFENLVVGHPMLNDILAAFSNYIFYQKLGWVGDIEAYQLFTLFVSSLLIFIVFHWAKEVYGIFAGITAALALVCYPLFFSESHFNIKDPVQSSFYAFTLYGFYRGIIKNSPPWILFSGVAAGFALGTKLNIVFSVFTLVPWFIVIKWDEIKKGRLGLNWQMAAAILAAPAIAIAILVASWPGMWGNPIGGLVTMYEWYKNIGYGTTYQTKEFISFGGFNTYPFQLVLFTTPLVALLLSTVGIVYTLRRGMREEHKTALLFLLWFLVPILRVSLPNMSIYSGGRQIMEYIPAMALLSGMGGREIAVWLSKTIKPLFIPHIIVLLLFIPIILKLFAIHPNQNVYFNPLIGGLAGAKERNFPSWGVSLGSVYVQGIDWLNLNAEKDGRISLVKGLTANIPEMKLREDLSLFPIWSGEKKEGEYLIEVVDYYWTRDIPREKRDYLDTLTPVYEVEVDGVSLLKIWRNSSTDGSSGGGNNSSSPQ